MLVVLCAGSEQGPDGPVGVAGIGPVKQNVAENYGSGLVVNQGVAFEQTLSRTVENIGDVRLPGFSLDVQVVKRVANQRGRHTVDLEIPGINGVLVGSAVAEKLHGDLRIGKRGSGQEEYEEDGKHRNPMDAKRGAPAGIHAR